MSKKSNMPKDVSRQDKASVSTTWAGQRQTRRICRNDKKRHDIGKGIWNNGLAVRRHGLYSWLVSVSPQAGCWTALHNFFIYKMTTGLRDPRSKLVLWYHCCYYDTSNIFLNYYPTSMEHSFLKAVFCISSTLLSMETGFKNQECLDFRYLFKES